MGVMVLVALIVLSGVSGVVMVLTVFIVVTAFGCFGDCAAEVMGMCRRLVSVGEPPPPPAPPPPVTDSIWGEKHELSSPGPSRVRGLPRFLLTSPLGERIPMTWSMVGEGPWWRTAS